jgi:GNAT superfamily N-acetyltransferase
MPAPIAVATSSPDRLAVSSRPLVEADLPDVDRIFRLAFGTYLGLPEPLRFAAGRDLIGPRWRWNPDGFTVAETGGRIIGSGVANRWGSIGFLGPLTVDPQCWDQGVGRRLMEVAMDDFARWKCPFLGLFTFPGSTKHVGLYQRFGFWPRFLTAIMTRVPRGETRLPEHSVFSKMDAETQADALLSCRALTERVFEGMDVGEEIVSVYKQKLGETIVLHGAAGADAVAVCHFGTGSEGGPEACYVKFAAVQPGPRAWWIFEQLLDACDALAVQHGLKVVEAGINTGREEAYRQMLAKGFRTQVQGLAMHKDGKPGYSRPGIFALDDWR